MFWNVSISLVWLCIVCTMIAAVLSYRKKSTGITKPINVVFSGIALAALFGIFPINYIAGGLSGNGVTKFIEALSLTIVGVKKDADHPCHVIIFVNIGMLMVQLNHLQWKVFSLLCRFAIRIV